MRNLKLDPSHRTKLLEMAKALFSEYNSVSVQSYYKGKYTTFTEGIEFKTDKISFPYKAMGNIDPFIAHKYMDWFEFCMTELAEKIYNPNPLKVCRALEQKICNFYWSMNLYWSNPRSTNPNVKHPIDYLYDEFKKLK